ncbi:universal stress protein [Streptomyces sp. ME01-24h]|nr:universal stress protein [Streptomyces sp. ME19-03-3]MDX3355472.1 universal stress protein [Streptomyces sp. ME01-24h]
MPRTVTAGLDGSPESRAAADWAAREALRRGLPLRLLHVHDRQPYSSVYAPLAGAVAGPDPDTQRRWAESVPRDAAAQLTGRHPDLEISAGLVSGQPAAALAAAAGESELLVLGSRGLGALAGFLVGSVASATVAQAVRPVVLVRAGQTGEDEHRPDLDGLVSQYTPFRDVVLGIDLDRPHEDLLAFAFEAAVLRGTGLRVVHGWNLPASYGFNPAAIALDLEHELTDAQAKALTQALAPWRAKYPAVEVAELSLAGGAARHLVEAAADASLVVVGRRVRHAAAGAHIGPVTHAVLHHAKAPVAVVPHD